MEVESLINFLQLRPHPEGGYYRETYRAITEIPVAGLPATFPGARSVATAIYYLLDKGNLSAFHRIKSDELWHYYAGGTLLIHVLNPDGNYTCHYLGTQLEKGETFQIMVPAGAWFASEPATQTDFALVGCTVAPGFDFADFELAQADWLVLLFPAQETLIRRLCRS